MDRRSFLSVGLGTALLGLAGCLTNTPGNTPGPIAIEPLPPDPTLQWLRRYGDTDTHESFSALIATSDDGFFAAGARMRTGDAAYLVRMNQDGEERWRRVIDGSHSVTAVEAEDGGIIVLLGPETPKLVALDADGETLWTRELRPTAAARYEFTDLVTAHDRGYLLVGSRIDPVVPTNDSAPSERRSVVAVAVDFDGRVRRERVFTAPEYAYAWDDEGNVDWGAGQERANAVVRSENGYLLLCENTDGAPYVRQLDSNGEQQWQRIYGRGYNSGLRAITPISSGYALVGHDSGDGAGGWGGPWVLAIDTEGEPIWSSGFDFGGTDRHVGADFMGLTTDEDGSVVVVGMYHPDGHQSERTRPMLAGISADGTEMRWIRQYGDRGGYGSTVVRTDDGSFVLAGQLSEAGPWTDAVLINAGRPTESNASLARRVDVRD